MRRTFLLGMALLLVVEAALVIPVLSFTSLGGRVLKALASPPTPTPVLSLHAQGTPPTIQAQAAYLIDADTGQVLIDVHGSDLGR
jgi:serine-type D-Ala-D-Ala carboxypeptidase (penicillin-binding protein 5/6)